MLFAGVEVVSLFINTIFPDTQGVISPILAVTSHQATKPELYAEIEGELDKITVAIKYLFYGIVAFGLGYFSWKIVMNIIEYFKSDDIHKQSEFKTNIKNNFIGIALVLLGSLLLNRLLMVFGFSSLITF